MSYRKIKKAFLRRFHCTLGFKLYDNDHKLMKKNSKKASAYVMSKGLYYNDKMWIFHINKTKQ